MTFLWLSCVTWSVYLFPAVSATTSGVAKAGPDRAHAQPKAPCFVPLMLRNLVQSTCEQLVYSRYPANTNDLAMPLATMLVLSGELAETQWLLDSHAWLILLDFRLSSS